MLPLTDEPRERHHLSSGTRKSSRRRRRDQAAPETPQEAFASETQESENLLLQRLQSIGVDRLSPPPLDPHSELMAPNGEVTRVSEHLQEAGEARWDATSKPTEPLHSRSGESTGETEEGKASLKISTLRPNELLGLDSMPAIRRQDSGKSLEDYIAEDLKALPVVSADDSLVTRKTSPPMSAGDSSSVLGEGNETPTAQPPRRASRQPSPESSMPPLSDMSLFSSVQSSTSASSETSSNSRKGKRRSSLPSSLPLSVSSSASSGMYFRSNDDSSAYEQESVASCPSKTIAYEPTVEPSTVKGKARRRRSSASERSISGKSKGSKASKRHSLSSLLGQDFVTLSSNDGLQEREDMSMDYSMGSELFRQQADDSGSQLNKSRSHSRSRRRSSMGSSKVGSSHEVSLHSITGKGNRSGGRQSYDGAMLQLVDSLHGSCGSVGSFNESFSTITGPLLNESTRSDTQAKSKRRHSLESKKNSSKPRRSSITSGETRSTTTSKASEGKVPRQSRDGHGKTSTAGKSTAQRRRSLNSTTSTSSESSAGARRRPPHKQQRRHSLGQSAHEEVPDSQEQSSCVVRNRTIDRDLQDSKDLSASLSSIATASVDIRNRDKQRAQRPPLTSPIRKRTVLKVDDMEKMRSSAPARLNRIRSPRRRQILLAQLAGPDDCARSAIIDKLSFAGLDESPASGSVRSVSLSTRDIASHFYGVEKRSSLSSAEGLVAGASKNRTRRTSNRTLDLLPEIAEAKSLEFSSSWSASSRRAMNSFATVIEDDNESVSSDSSGESDEEDPRVLMSLQSSAAWNASCLTYKAVELDHLDNISISSGSSSPDLPPLSRTFSDHASPDVPDHLSSQSRALSASSSGSIIFDGTDPLKRLDSFCIKSIVSKDSTYDLRPYDLAIPDPSLHSTISTEQEDVTANSMPSTTGRSVSTYDLRPVDFQIPEASTHELSPVSTPESHATITSVVYPVNRMCSHVSSRTNCSELTFDTVPWPESSAPNPSSNVTTNSCLTYDLRPVPWSIPESPTEHVSSVETHSSGLDLPKRESPSAVSMSLQPVRRIDSRVSAHTACSEITWDSRSPPGHQRKKSFSMSGIDAASGMPSDYPVNIPTGISYDTTKELIRPLATAPVVPNPIWKTLEREKQRQDILRAKLVANQQ